uniref:Uncharacterized protein n=1 Tax=Aegilops tauschii subsp. strangulata TaxID=200361 RepID=A0A453K8J3_AEGTS
PGPPGHPLPPRVHTCAPDGDSLELPGLSSPATDNFDRPSSLAICSGCANSVHRDHAGERGTTHAACPHFLLTRIPPTRSPELKHTHTHTQRNASQLDSTCCRRRRRRPPVGRHGPALPAAHSGAVLRRRWCARAPPAGPFGDVSALPRHRPLPRPRWRLLLLRPRLPIPLRRLPGGLRPDPASSPADGGQL